MLDSANEDQAIAMVNEILQVERDNPNANFRLGMLYAGKYKSTDPLKQFEMAMEYANRTRLQMVKSKAVIDNREIRRNEEWYASVIPGGGGGLSFEAIQQLLDNEYQMAGEFIDSIPPAYTSFTKAVLTYDKAKKVYADVARNYSSLKELYLLYDASLETKLKEIQSLYDSTHYYFNRYKNLKEGTAIKYDQELIVKDIKVYRKDGLATQTDFFNSEIEIWNYKSWSENVISEVTSSITSLRTSLQENYEKVNKKLESIKSGTSTEEFVEVDKELVFNLSRLDYQNAIVPMLEYNQFQQEYLTRRQELSRLEADTSINQQTKLQLYTLLLYESIEADSILADLINRSQDEERLMRHRDFIAQNFGDVAGFKQKSVEEKAKTEEEYDSYVNLIRTTISSISREEEKENISISFQRMQFHILPENKPLDSLKLNTPITTHAEENPDGSTYIAGAVIRNAKAQHSETFIGKVDANMKMLWMKFFDIRIDESNRLANHSPSSIRATQKGILAAIKSEVIDTAQVINNLIYVSDMGEELLSVRVENEEPAQFINYQENTSSFIITYYDPQATKGNFEILSVTDTGSVVWDKKMSFTGVVKSVINVYEGVVFLGTATYWKSDESELTKNTPALFISKLDLQGNIIEEKMVDGFRLDRAYKVNDSNISLMSNLSAAELPPGSTSFIITNSSLEMVYPRKEE